MQSVLLLLFCVVFLLLLLLCRTVGELRGRCAIASMYESGPQLSDSVRRAQLLRVVARWLSEARCSRAALILARSVGVIGHTHAIKTSSVGDSSRRQVLCVNVETMSGVKLGTFKGLSASTSTIGDLKQKLADRLGDAFPPELQRLFAVGSSVHFWDASATFRKCGVEDGATLVLVLQANFEWDVKASNKHLKYALLGVLPVPYLGCFFLADVVIVL